MNGATGRPSDTVAAIERELAEIWTVPDPATGTAKVRASTLNYVAAAAPPALEGLRQMTDELAETHAGRVLLLWVDGRLPPWELWHEVSGVCRPSAGTSVCNDRVEIAFGAVAAERAASVVRALVLPEIPVVAEIAAGAPSLLVYALGKIAHRLVVDSQQMRFGPIVELGRQGGAPLADRAWVRTFSWRDLSARFFDEAPSGAAAVRRVSIARVHPAAGGGDPAHLLLGWLASRLGWVEFGRHGARRPDGGAVLVDVTDAPAEAGQAGELTSIRFELGAGDSAEVCEVARVGAGRDVRWSRTRAGEVLASRDMSLGHRDETWVLTKAIESSDGDAVYRDAAAAAAKWEAWWAT